jgi:hypothetical protein
MIKRNTILDRQASNYWDSYRDNLLKATPIDTTETPQAQKARIAQLEANDEAWFKYYFPAYAYAEPAPFHKAATKRIMKNNKWYEVRAWSRELAKSTRTMMEIVKLGVTGKVRNVLLVSHSADNAQELLTPYMINLESNARLINDYGKQQKLGSWGAANFTTRKGFSMKSIGAGQSPRGTRKEEVRPDAILIDDIDTDEEVRNMDRVNAKWKWIEEALIPTVSISGNKRIIFCGNIIAKDCCITRAIKIADHVDIINIRDKTGISSWPTKNSEADIDYILSKISYEAGQKEYYNNPIDKGDVFKETTYNKVPPIHTCDAVLVYADPSTSNKDKSTASNKAVVIVGRKLTTYFIYKVWLDTGSNARFVDWLYAAYLYLQNEKVDTKKIYIENNSLQDPHFSQVLMPLIFAQSKATKIILPITPDTRKKPDKFFRIEGTLEPKNRLGQLVFNTHEKDDPHMKRMDAQMLGVSKNSKTMDGPDALEGGVWILDNKYNDVKSNMHLVKRKHNLKRI